MYVTVILVLCYFMLCAFVTYSNKLLLLLLLRLSVTERDGDSVGILTCQKL